MFLFPSAYSLCNANARKKLLLLIRDVCMYAAHGGLEIGSCYCYKSPCDQGWSPPSIPGGGPPGKAAPGRGYWRMGGSGGKRREHGDIGRCRRTIVKHAVVHTIRVVAHLLGLKIEPRRGRFGVGFIRRSCDNGELSKQCTPSNERRVKTAHRDRPRAFVYAHVRNPLPALQRVLSPSGPLTTCT